MAGGYVGQILRVNLSDGTTDVQRPDDSWYRRYVGGSAVVAYYLLREVAADCDPLGAENRLIFATGPLTGVPLAGAGRNSVGARSPLTGGFGDSQGGGWWMAELKRAGFDHIVVQGRASHPVYLYIDDGRAEIRDARHLWGRDTAEVQELIRRDVGDERVRVVQCGRAGENLVRYACIINDLTHFCGRTGTGAVMGAKRLRAIAVRGTGRIPVHDEERVMELARSMNRAVAVGERNASQRAMGTPGGVMNQQVRGGLPTCNFQAGQFRGAEEISGQRMQETLLVGRDTCFACPVHCKQVVADDEYGIDPIYGGPEYETLASFGSNCGVSDLTAVCKANELCNRWGLDTISCGMTISFVMECFERGLIRADQLDGIEAFFGNADAVLQLIEKIAHRDGIGDLLAEGAARAAEEFGPETAPFALHVKGQEFPMHEPRLKAGLGLGYSVSPTGADHCHNIQDTALVASADDLNVFGITEPLPADDLSADKVRMMYFVANFKHFLNCALMCQFVAWSRREIVQLMRAVTGWETSTYEVLRAGERAATMARLFNLRCGLNDRDDRLSERFFRPFTEGPIAGSALRRKQLDRARIFYYHMMGWDDLGRPTLDRLAELKIEDLRGDPGYGER